MTHPLTHLWTLIRAWFTRQPAGRLVRESDLGAAWPLLYRHARVYGRHGAAFAEIDGTTYALNGLAHSQGFPSCWEIQRIDPSFPADLRAALHQAGQPIPRMSVEPLRALALQYPA